MTEVKASDYPQVYGSLKIETHKLGVVMLDVEPFEVTDLVTAGANDLYYSQDPTQEYVQGPVAEESAHVTLLYGLLSPGPEWKAQIDAVLSDWTPPVLKIESIGSFPSHGLGGDYATIVGHIKVTDELMEGHQRLSLLPHINTFGLYRPHVTLAYVNKSAKNKWVTALSDAGLAGKGMPVTKINLGK